MKILVFINAAIFLALSYTMSFTEERAEIVYTNVFAEFITDPLAFVWACTYGIILGFLFTRN